MKFLNTTSFSSDLNLNSLSKIINLPIVQFHIGYNSTLTKLYTYKFNQSLSCIDNIFFTYT